MKLPTSFQLQTKQLITYSWLSAFKSSERWALSRISLSSTAPSLDPAELSLFWGTLSDPRGNSSSTAIRSITPSSAESPKLPVDCTLFEAEGGNICEMIVGRRDTGSVGAESVTEVCAGLAEWGVLTGVASVSSSMAVTNVRLLDMLLDISWPLSSLNLNNKQFKHHTEIMASYKIMINLTFVT